MFFWTLLWVSWTTFQKLYALCTWVGFLPVSILPHLPPPPIEPLLLRLNYLAGTKPRVIFELEMGSGRKVNVDTGKDVLAFGFQRSWKQLRHAEAPGMLNPVHQTTGHKEIQARSLQSHLIRMNYRCAFLFFLGNMSQSIHIHARAYAYTHILQGSISRKNINYVLPNYSTIC